MQTLPPPAADTAAPELEPILEKFPQGSVEPQEGLDQPTWIVRREVLADLCRELKADPATQFDMLMDLTGVDFPDREERFEAVYHLYSVHRNARLRLKVPMKEGETVLPSLVKIWRGADWPEREAFDMFGFRFEGHPNLRRILLADDWDEGFPLRKDYPLRGWKEFPVYNTERTVGRVRTRWTGRGV